MAMVYTLGKQDVFFLILLAWFSLSREMSDHHVSNLNPEPAFQYFCGSSISVATRMDGCIFRVYLVQVPTTDSFSSAADRPAYQDEVWVLSTILPSSV